MKFKKLKIKLSQIHTVTALIRNTFPYWSTAFITLQIVFAFSSFPNNPDLGVTRLLVAFWMILAITFLRSNDSTLKEWGDTLDSWARSIDFNHQLIEENKSLRREIIKLNLELRVKQPKKAN